MSAELWQFAAVGGIGAVIVLLWLFVVYLPRRTGEGSKRNPEDTWEDSAENDDLS